MNFKVLQRNLFFFFKSSTYSAKPCLLWSASFSCMHWIRGGGTPCNGLYGEAPPERGTFYRLQVYERVGILPVQVYERVGKSVTWSVKWPKKATEGSFVSVKSSRKFSGFVQWFIRLQQLKGIQSFKLGQEPDGLLTRYEKGGNICQWKEYERGIFCHRNVI